MIDQKRTCFICINGIRTDPGDPRAWTDRMVTAIQRRTPADVKAEKFEYHTLATTRWWRQAWRADALREMVEGYQADGWRVVTVGHSNGCDLIARVLAKGVGIFSAHLFAAAAEEEPFAEALKKGGLRRAHLYGSPDDRALKTASWSRKVLRLVGLGYGSLGLRGPAFARLYPRSADHSIPGYDHDTWFLHGPYFESTLGMLLANHAQDVAAESPKT